jgi:hypothetical protein
MKPQKVAIRTPSGISETRVIVFVEFALFGRSRTTSVTQQVSMSSRDQEKSANTIAVEIPSLLKHFRSDPRKQQNDNSFS